MPRANEVVCLTLGLLLGATLPAIARAKRAGKELPRDTLVRIRMLDEVSSRNSSRGDRFRYEVVEDVVHERRTWITKGTRASGFLRKVKRAGRFGQNGKLEAAFGSVMTASGKPVLLTISKKATQQNNQDKYAAGAAFVGLMALGPIGLAGAAFVKGEDVTIRKGAELYVTTEVALR
jgi:hypothetical protein